MSKKLVIISIILIVLGLTISLIGFAKVNFDPYQLSNHYEVTYEINDEFNSIECNLDLCDLNLYLSLDGKNKAVCVENDRSKVEVTVNDNTLKVIENTKFQIIDFVQDAKVNLYLSKDIYNSLKVTGSTGDVYVSSSFKFSNVDLSLSTSDVKFESKVENDLNIKLSTGDVKLSNVTVNNLNIETSTGDIKILNSIVKNDCKFKFTSGGVKMDNVSVDNNLNIVGSTGDAKLSNVTGKNANIKLSTGDSLLSSLILSNELTIEVSTGDIKFDGSDALNIYITTTTGDVKGTILTNKVFNVKTSTGDISYPETDKGGICKITTTTGDVKISYK